MTPSGSNWTTGLIKWIPILILVLGGVISAFLRDNLNSAYLAWAIALIIALAWWWYAQNRRWTVLLAIAVVAVPWVISCGGSRNPTSKSQLSMH